jgi:hypothetical protein
MGCQKERKRFEIGVAKAVCDSSRAEHFRYAASVVAGSSCLPTLSLIALLLSLRANRGNQTP